METTSFLPQDDGITHINIYSGSKCPLGRRLSHFAYTPFEHPQYGQFNCMEGYWYYVSTGFKHEEFKTLIGFKAKAYQRVHQYKRSQMDELAFQELIYQGNLLKINQTPGLRTAVIESTLPFTHYYVIADKLINQPNSAQWLIDQFEKIRKELKELTK